ncbi:MAG TPA: hypothetical protein VG125_05825, partial [Pirellulales bacterium]|nr:hypothetical protein [Pirellulales bacterium]
MITHTKSAVEDWANASVERSSKRATRARGWALNWRLLITTAALLALVSPLVHFWHAYQVERNASALLVFADGYESRGEWLKAAQDLHRYLQLKPTDVETIVRMAEDFCKGARLPVQKARAVQLYARAIAVAPDREDLQRRQMVLRLEAGDHGAARRQAEQLLVRTPDDPAALRVQALAMHRQWRLRRSDASEVLLKAFRAAIDK